MTTLAKVLVVAFLFLASAMHAQDFQGVATYKSKRKLDIKIDSTQMDSGMHSQMMEMLKKKFEKTYLLSFNKEASVYKEEETLGAPQPQGMEVIMVSSGGSDVLYKNTKEGTFTNQSESFSKLFLIQDKLEKLDWTLGSETKNIGEYTCYKATATKEIEVIESGISINGDKDLDAKAEPKKKQITITAWYTPQIPVNNGPGNYYGLPGLILEVNDGSETVMCSKIVLNPKKELEISEPKKGKKVSQKEYDAIMEKKLKEMQEMYSSDRGDGHNIEIRIGG